MRKVAIIFNKGWELEPALAAMCSPEFRPANLPFPLHLESLKDRRPPNSAYTSGHPRAVFHFHEKGDDHLPLQLEVGIWCIQDMMDKTKSSSDTTEKYRVLPPVLTEYNPDLVIAVGTAGFPSAAPVAGCVVAGSHFFMHDGHPGNTPHLDLPNYEKLFPPNLNPQVLGLINPAFKAATEPLFAKPPNNPCVRPALSASNYYVAVSSFNVLDYGEYTWVDNQAVAAYQQLGYPWPVGSIETTHALIRLSSDKPCMFVSAITDSEGRFDIEVTNPQNYFCAFNTGIVLAQLVMTINSQLATNINFPFVLA